MSSSSASGVFAERHGPIDARSAASTRKRCVTPLTGRPAPSIAPDASSLTATTRRSPRALLRDTPRAPRAECRTTVREDPLAVAACIFDHFEQFLARGCRGRCTSAPSSRRSSGTVTVAVPDFVTTSPPHSPASRSCTLQPAAVLPPARPLPYRLHRFRRDRPSAERGDARRCSITDIPSSPRVTAARNEPTPLAAFETSSRYSSNRRRHA
jgi:hypothetical protein